jgi:hypothetical protein
MTIGSPSPASRSFENRRQIPTPHVSATLSSEPLRETIRAVDTFVKAGINPEQIPS